MGDEDRRVTGKVTENQRKILERMASNTWIAANEPAEATMKNTRGIRYGS